MKMEEQKTAKKSFLGSRPGVRPETQNAIIDIQKTYGFVPELVNSMPDAAIPGAWSEVKNLFYNPNTALEPKLKALIGYAVAVQMPSDLQKYTNLAMAKIENVSAQEQSEALLMSALTRHWSTVLNGSQMDAQAFEREVDQCMEFVSQNMLKARGQLPPEENFLVNFSSAQEAYDDMQKSFGIVPQFFRIFPEVALAGAWSEFKALQMNPYTALKNRDKELIGLAVASQIPCSYCIYFHKRSARLFGATEREIEEAIALSALTRHWAAIFHGADMDSATFFHETDQMIAGLQSKAPLHS